MPLVLGEMAIAGSPLDLAELERLANEMFRAGPEGAGLGAQTPVRPEVNADGVMGQPPEIDGFSPDGPPEAASSAEVLQWSSLMDGARPAIPGGDPGSLA
jgi:hypothetical protein